jgi:hypothetical protein
MLIYPEVERTDFNGPFDTDKKPELFVVWGTPSYVRDKDTATLYWLSEFSV